MKVDDRLVISKPIQSIAELLKRLWWHIDIKRRKQLGILLLLTILASLAEIMSIGAVLPFLAVITNPDRIFVQPLIQPIIRYFSWTESYQLILPITLLFGSLTLIAGGMRLLLLWVNTRLSFLTGADLGVAIYKRTLFQPYAIHCSRNSSEVIAGISTKASAVIYDILLPVLTIASGSVMILAILVMLFWIDPFVAILSFVVLGCIYLGIVVLTRKQLSINSQLIARASGQVIKSLQEGLGGIRDVLLDGSQMTYLEVYRKSDASLRKAQGSNLFIAMSPRYGMEAFGMLFIALLAFFLTRRGSGFEGAIPLLGALALGAQRLLPTLQQVYASWTSIKGGQSSLQDTIILLDQKLPEFIQHGELRPVGFTKKITIENLHFRYSTEMPWVIKGLNLTIPKGARIGFIGPTGGGKSTLLDIVMGLLQPTVGHLRVDDQLIDPLNNAAWQTHIAHVPQSIFLADATVEENIAFGLTKDEIDHDRVRRAAQQARIADSIDGWPRKYQTRVGERGINLSGGQRQRIGIARALYKNADLIIFDEATSALDAKTEDDVMRTIEELSKDLTLLIIAHRVHTLKNCSEIVEISDGKVFQISSFLDVVNKLNAKP
jgi:ATP-binding cassette, subfamily B, bacterial PglK